MASTLKADKADKSPVTIPTGVVVVPFSYSLAAALVVADVIELCEIPKYATILDYFISVPDLDSHATPTITLDLGVDGTGEHDSLVDGSTIGQSAGYLTPDGTGAVAGGVPYKNWDATTAGAQADEVTLKLTVATAVATGATSGTIKGWVMYTMAEQYTETISAS